MSQIYADDLQNVRICDHLRHLRFSELNHHEEREGPEEGESLPRMERMARIGEKSGVRRCVGVQR